MNFFGDPNSPYLIPAALMTMSAVAIALAGIVRTVHAGLWAPVLLHMAVACTVDTISAILLRGTQLACLMASMAAFFFWMWWTRGGGKRRMKKLLRKFKPVRRTAPQPT